MNGKPLAVARERIISLTVSSVSQRSKLVSSLAARPDSILDISKTSLMSPSRWVPLRLMISRFSFWLSLSVGSVRIS